MIGVAFYFEDVVRNISSGVVDAVMDRTVMDCKNLGATHLFMVDATQYRIGQYYQHVDSEIEFGYYTAIDEVEEDNLSTPFVYLEREITLDDLEVGDKHNLISFVHPESVIYVVGADMGSATIIPGRLDKQWVYVPVNMLWAETTLKLCLYDRLVKEV